MNQGLHQLKIHVWEENLSSRLGENVMVQHKNRQHAFDIPKAFFQKYNK